MKAIIHHKKQPYTIDLSNPIDISIPLRGSKNPVAWYLDQPEIQPVQTDDWIGKVSEGGPVNFNTITFNPHAHGTHTECLGHITEQFYSINNQLKKHFFLAELITVAPEVRENEFVLSRKQIANHLKGKSPEAVVIRTIPNTSEKKSMQWSNTHWPFIAEAAMVHLRKMGVQHLLIDLPSVDPEKDDGALRSHKAFWDTEGTPRLEATITEMIYVKHSVHDGSYLLNLQVAPFHNDAAPSRPVLYRIEK